KIQRCQGCDCTGQQKWHKGHSSDHRIRQYVTQNNAWVADTQCAGSTNIFEITSTQKFGANNINKGSPAEQRHDTQQPPEVRGNDARQNNQQKQHRQRTPYLKKTLAEQISSATVISLDGCDGYTDQRAAERQGKRKQDGDTKAIDNAGDHVPGLIIGTQPVILGGRRGGRQRQIMNMSIVAVGNQGPQDPAIGLNKLFDIGITVVCGCIEVAAECGLWIILKGWKIEIALIPDQHRAVIGNQFRSHADGEQHGKKYQAPEGAPI